MHCFLSPVLLRHLSRSPDPGTKELAVEALVTSARVRAIMEGLAALPQPPSLPSPNGKRYRVIYSAGHRSPADLPGRVVRSEGRPEVKDPAVNLAYRNAGITYDFYRRVFGRNSLDGKGMVLVSSVHLGKKFYNALWTGGQMVYGDGDGRIFVHPYKPLEVVAHEMTHGVIAHTSRLEYRGEAGALNESFADVMGSLVRQWKRRETVRQADWRIGHEMLGPGVQAKAIRTLTGAKAFENDPLLGTDPQPKHMKDLYRGPDNDIAVHLNSGIPNHAFYRAAMALGGRGWERLGRVWYQAMTSLPSRCGFGEAAERTAALAKKNLGTAAGRSVRAAWRAVGL